MITSVKINDNANTPLRYVEGIDALSNGKEYNFKKGVNIIIGKNGCGKSTLLKLISKYTLCHNKMKSEAPNASMFGGMLEIEDMFNGNDGLKDGVSVKCDYAGVVYNVVEPKDFGNDDILKDSMIASMYIDCKSSSTGESVLSKLGSTFDFAFKNKDIMFPLKRLQSIKDNSNDLWQKRLESLLSYYKDNRVKIGIDDFEYTFLVDEPDRNLDISNIETIYEILSFHKERTQLICVVHNQILIYKLSMLPHVNFIEMTEGYLDEIKSVFRSFRYCR